MNQTISPGKTELLQSGERRSRPSQSPVHHADRTRPLSSPPAVLGPTRSPDGPCQVS